MKHAMHMSEKDVKSMMDGHRPVMEKSMKKMKKDKKHAKMKKEHEKG